MTRIEKLKAWVREAMQPIPYVTYIPLSHLAPEEKGDTPLLFAGYQPENELESPPPSQGSGVSSAMCSHCGKSVNG